MASVRVNLRIPADVWAAVSAYAKGRESSNTAVVVAALRGFLDDAALEKPPVRNPPAASRALGDPRLAEPTRDQFRTAAELARAQARWDFKKEW